MPEVSPRQFQIDRPELTHRWQGHLDRVIESAIEIVKLGNCLQLRWQQHSHTWISLDALLIRSTSERLVMDAWIGGVGVQPDGQPRCHYSPSGRFRINTLTGELQLQAFEHFDVVFDDNDQIIRQDSIEPTLTYTADRTMIQAGGSSWATGLSTPGWSAIDAIDELPTIADYFFDTTSYSWIESIAWDDMQPETLIKQRLNRTANTLLSR